MQRHTPIVGVSADMDDAPRRDRDGFASCRDDESPGVIEPGRAAIEHAVIRQRHPDLSPDGCAEAADLGEEAGEILTRRCNCQHPSRSG